MISTFSVAFGQYTELQKLQSFANQYIKNKNYETAKEKLYTMFALANSDSTQDKTGKIYPWMVKKMVFIFGTVESNPDSVIHYCQIGIDKSGSDDYLYSQMAYYLGIQGKNREAAEAYTKALETADQSKPTRIADTYRRISDIYFSLYEEEENQEDLMKSIETIEMACELDSENQEYKNIRDGRRSLLDPTELIAKLEEQLATEPDNLKAKKDIVGLYRQQGEDGKAKPYLDDVLEAEPENIPMLEYRAKISVSSGSHSQALKDYKKINEVTPENINSAIEIARIYKDNLNNNDQARSWAWKVVNSGKQTQKGYYILGQIFEDIAQSCVDSKGGFEKLDLNDRLVYHIAYVCFKKGGGNGKSKANSLKEITVTKSQKFMDGKTNFPKTACYSWIKPDMPEVKWMQEDWGKI
ncbi:MAG: hypothetical protein DWQ06_05005 [Calditrichaeota bacterium]|nr:MAG: hypothetical protein DWQ06_05005 [Calditrichota bacterium]